MVLPNPLPKYDGVKVVSDVVNMTHSQYRKTFTDQVFLGSPFQAHLLMTGRVNLNGGVDLVDTIEVVKDAAAPALFDPDTNPKYEPQWKQISLPTRFNYTSLFGGVVVTDFEAARNTGNARILNLVTKKFKNAEKTLSETMENMLCHYDAATIDVPNDVSNSDPGSPWLSLGQIVAKGGTIGGLTGGTGATNVPEWQSPIPAKRARKTNADDDPTLAVEGGKGRSYLSRLTRTINRGGKEHPDLILTDQETFGRIEENVWDKVRLRAYDGTSEKHTQMQFDNFMFGRAVVMYTDAETLEPPASDKKRRPIYILNSDYFELVCNSAMWMNLIGPTRNTNSVANSWIIQSMGQLTTNGRKFHTVSWQDVA